ncbi:type IV secretion system DNA-binding domain-containing protein [Microbacterium lacus]|uniref:type IV secretion system DNA-binding domain-containing protein n=1 Tax=Microbacterium lacus TaxID=415217 RepID=UPI000C2C78CA|nr:type IV secretion system DNA-binding domain-containing protein [Microbacterium lacus]
MLHETFVDSGIIDVLDSVDHQVLYGRRGTGKTHAFSFLGSEIRTRGDIALYVDLRGGVRQGGVRIG